MPTVLTSRPGSCIRPLKNSDLSISASTFVRQLSQSKSPHPTSCRNPLAIDWMGFAKSVFNCSRVQAISTRTLKVLQIITPFPLPQIHPFQAWTRRLKTLLSNHITRLLHLGRLRTATHLILQQPRTQQQDMFCRIRMHKV